VSPDRRPLSWRAVCLVVAVRAGVLLVLPGGHEGELVAVRPGA
jgi:hypothetical protein